MRKELFDIYNALKRFPQIVKQNCGWGPAGDYDPRVVTEAECIEAEEALERLAKLICEDT